MSGERKRRSHNSLQRAGRPIIESLEQRQLMSLTIDVTGAGGPGGNNTAQVSFPGQVLNLQVWAVITDPQNLPSESGVQDVDGSFLATNVGPGPVAGNLTAAAVISPFDANGSQNGTSQDLNGDGNLDIGSNDNSTVDNFFFARSGGMQTASPSNVVGNTAQFQIGTLTYTVTSLNFGGEEDINFRPRQIVNSINAAVWREDDQAENDAIGDFTGGTPFVITSPGANPPPIAVDDTANTSLNTPVTVHVLSNDPATYAANDPTSVKIITQPADGTASANSDGTVLYIPSNGFIGSDSFTYTVNDINGKTSNVATVDVSTGLELSSAKGGEKSVTYTDADGTVATISLNKGVADLAFTGNASATTKNGKITLSGTGTAITGIALSGTSKASVLTITGKGGDGVVDIASITDSTDMGKINAPVLDLGNQGGTSSFASLSGLQVHSLNGANVTAAGPAALMITAPTITNSSIAAPTATVSLNSGSVTSTILSALSDKTIKVTGAVTSDTLSNTSTAIAGQLIFNGDVLSSSFTSGGAFKNVSANSLTNSTITSGPIASVHVKGVVSHSNILLNGHTSGTIRIVVGGSLEAGSTITTAGTLAALSAGTISDTNITTAGDILALSTSSLSGSTVLAGTSGDVTLDSVTAANLGANQIRSIKVSKTFSDSTVIAQTIGSASLGEVSNTGTTPTGLGAQVYKSAKLSVNGIALNLTSKQFAILKALQDALTAKNVTSTLVDNGSSTPVVLFGSDSATLLDADFATALVANNG